MTTSLAENPSSWIPRAGGFQEIRDRRFKDLQIFWLRYIRAGSGKEQERKPTFTGPPIDVELRIHRIVMLVKARGP
jgi:hypothetical protein